MKKLLFLILLAPMAFGQLTKNPAYTTYSFEDTTAAWFMTRSAIIAYVDTMFSPSDTTQTFWTTRYRSDSLIALRIAYTDTSLTWFVTRKTADSLLALKLAAADTASLSARINLKLAASDTASLSSRIDLKLTKTDTSSLSSRIDLKLTKTDTSSLSSRIDLKLTKTDTSSLSDRINLKVTASDTATWLPTWTDIEAQGYGTGTGDISSVTVTAPVTGGGTSGALTVGVDTSVLATKTDIVGKLTATDTLSLSNRINLKLTSTDTSSLSSRIDLKLAKTDTASLSSRINLKLTSTDTSSLSSRINTKLTATDTASLSSRIDAKLAASDTASMSATNLQRGTLPIARLPNSGVSAGTYNFANIVVDQYGRVTTATSSTGSTTQYIGGYFYDTTGITATTNPVWKFNGTQFVIVEGVVIGTDSATIPYAADTDSLGSLTIGGGLTLAGATLHADTTVVLTPSDGRQQVNDSLSAVSSGTRALESPNIGAATGGSLALSGTLTLTSTQPIKLADSSFLSVTGGGGGGGVYENLMLGYRAGQSLVGTGYANTLLGTSAGAALNGTAPAASSNVMIGYISGLSSTTGSFNTFLGTATGAGQTTTNNNTLIGYHAGRINAYEGTTAVGYLALENATGKGNTAVGSDALKTITSSTNNSAFGYFALAVTTDGGGGLGFSNSAFGFRAGIANTTGYVNSFFGEDAGYTNTDGFGNTFMGRYAGNKNLHGDNNTYLGRSAGETATGDNNVFLGAFAGNLETGSNTFVIDNQSRTTEANARVSALMYGLFDATPSNQTLRLNASLGLNTTPYHLLSGSSTGNGIVIFNPDYNTVYNSAAQEADTGAARLLWIAGEGWRWVFADTIGGLDTNATLQDIRDHAPAAGTYLVPDDTLNLNALAEAALPRSEFADSAQVHSLGVGTLTTGEELYAASADSMASHRTVWNVKLPPFNATSDSTGNSTAAIQAALDSAGATNPPGIVLVPPGKYLIGDPGYVDIPSGVRVMAYGAIFYKTYDEAQYTVRLLGSVSATSSLLTHSTSLSYDTVRVTDATGFAAGDYVVLFDSTYIVDPDDGRNQELNRIDTLVGPVVTLSKQTIGYYSSGLEATLQKINAVANASVEGLTIVVPEGIDGGGFYTYYAYNCAIRNCVVEGTDSKEAVNIVNSADITMSGSTLRDGKSIATQGHGAGFNVSLSQNVNITGNWIEHMRASAVTIFSRYVLVKDNHFMGCYESAVNTHGWHCQFVSFVNNIIYGTRSSGGILVGWDGSPKGDTDILIEGNIIHNPWADGILIEGQGVKGYGKRIRILNNEIYNAGMVYSGYHGIYVHEVSDVEISGNLVTSGAVTQDGIGLLADTNVTVRNNTIANLTIGNGIAWSTSKNVTLENNTIRSCGGTALSASGTNAGIADGSVEVFTFGAGTGAATDTSVFTATADYGSFFNKTDTLEATSLDCFMRHGIGTDTLTVDVMWDDTLGGTGAVHLNTTPLAILGEGSKTSDVSFDNAKIPPGVVVWATTPTVVAGRKPVAFRATLSARRIHP